MSFGKDTMKTTQVAIMEYENNFAYKVFQQDWIRTHFAWPSGIPVPAIEH